MSFSRRITIIDGVEIPFLPYKDLQLLFDNFITNSKEKSIIKECAKYHNITIDEVNSDYFFDFLHDCDYIIDDEFLSSMYIGTKIIEVDEDCSSSARKISTLPQFPHINNSIFEFIKNVFPEYHIDRYLVNWVL